MSSVATDKRVAVFFAEGFEEIEGLTVVDLLYRAGIPCDSIAVAAEATVTSSHGVRIVCDRMIGDPDFDFDAYDMLVLPGGMPGTTNLGECAPLVEQVSRFLEQGREVAAICAAPTILATAGLLRDRRATCYPDLQQVLVEQGAKLCQDEVVVDGSLITSKGMGTAIPFGLEIVAHYLGRATADKVAASIVYAR